MSARRWRGSTEPSEVVAASSPGTPAARSVLAAAVANLAAGTLFAWSLVAQDASADVGMSRRSAAAVFATAIVVFTAVLLAVGPAQRRWGPRLLLYAAAGSGGAGLLLAATATAPLALWSGVALLFGTANGLGYGVAVGLAARVPERRRGTATGFVVAAYAAGPVLLGLVAPSALHAFGWRPCLAVLAALVGALLAVAARLAPAEGTRPRDPGARPPARLPRRPVVLLWLVFAGGTAPALALFANAVPLAADRGLSPQTTGLAVSALAAGNLAGRLVAGWASDRIGRLPALTATLVVAAVSVAALMGPPVPVVLAGFLGTGFAYGAVSSLVPAATADRIGADGFPAAYGRVFTGWGCAGLLAPLAGEQVLRLHADHPAWLGLAAVPLIPAAAAVLLLAGHGSRDVRS